MLMGMKRCTHDRLRLEEIDELLRSVRANIKTIAKDYDKEWISLYLRYLFWTRLSSLQLNFGHTSHTYQVYA